MSSTVMNKVEATVSSMDISDTMRPGAGVRSSKRLQRHGQTDRAQPVTPGADKLAKQLSEYNIHKTISTGSSCSVYIGQRAGHRAPVAVKVMSAQKRSRLAKKGLTIEIKCLKKVQVPGKSRFVRFVESFVDKYNHYIVLEYVPRGTLWSCIERAGGTLPVTLVRMIMAELVDGLSCLKQKRIIHRDIKPENLMIDMFGHIVIVDFGLAHMFDDDEPEVAKCGRSVCGTPGYIAPELVDGKDYSYAVDVWSAGCVMFELLTGARPYEGKTYEDVCRSMKSGHYKFPSKPRLDYLTKNFVSRLLEDNPDKRASLEDMKDMPFFGEIDWDRVANGDYDASYYLHFTRERGIPINKAINKATLINEALIDEEWYPDSEDLKFVVPAKMTAGLLDSPQEPIYSKSQENRAEELFYRRPYYIGKQWDDDAEDRFRVAHPICSGGSSEFLPDDDGDDDDDEKANDSLLESVDLTIQDTEIEYFPPPHALRRIPIPGLAPSVKERTRYVPGSGLVDPYVRQRQNFMKNYGKRDPPVAIDEKRRPKDAQSEVEPVISRRGLCILNIPDLIHSDSCITTASSLPTTPLDYDLPDDAWAPNTRKKLGWPEPTPTHTGIRGFFKDLGSVRRWRFGWGI